MCQAVVESGRFTGLVRSLGALALALTGFPYRLGTLVPLRNSLGSRALVDSLFAVLAEQGEHYTSAGYVSSPNHKIAVYLQVYACRLCV